MILARQLHFKFGLYAEADPVQLYSYLAEFDLAGQLITEQKVVLGSLAAYRGYENLHVIRPHLIAKFYSQTFCGCSDEVHSTLMEVSQWERTKGE